MFTTTEYYNNSPPQVLLCEQQKNPTVRRDIDSYYYDNHKPDRPRDIVNKYCRTRNSIAGALLLYDVFESRD